MKWILLVLSLAEMASAQSDLASLSGLVNDKTGSRIPGVKVFATLAATNSKWETETNGSGAYSFTALRVGIYQVTVQAPGFKTAVADGIELGVQQKATLDLVMEVGLVTER